jgi:starch synthase
VHIVFAASECVPFAKTGGLADVVGALPPELVKLGHRVTVYLPLYKSVRPFLPKS